MPLPHIKNSQAGVNRWEPVHTNLFELYFTLPEALRADFGEDEVLLTEQVISISGLNTLDKGPEIIEQKFMGTTRSFIAPKIDKTSHLLEIKLNLNLRNATDNFVYKLFKAWNRLGYNIETGETNIKTEYVADWLKVSIANRRGDIIEDILYKDIMLEGGIEAFNELNYDTNDALQLTVKFRSDWADSVIV